jgi:hypothetical protein
MNTTMKIAKGLLVLVVAAASLTEARAQSPNVIVNNKVSNGHRRLEVIVEDTATPRFSEEAPEGIPAVVLTAPDGGQIKGTLIKDGKQFAVTETRLLGVGDTIRGFKVVEVTLDSVRLSGTAHTYELDLASGQWTSGADAGVAE